MKTVVFVSEKGGVGKTRLSDELYFYNVIKLSKLRLLAVSSLMARSLFRFCRPF